MNVKALNRNSDPVRMFLRWCAIGANGVSSKEDEADQCTHGTRLNLPYGVSLFFMRGFELFANTLLD